MSGIIVSIPPTFSLLCSTLTANPVIVSTHTHIHTRSSHQVGNKIEDEDEDESEDGSDEMLNLEAMDEDGDLEVGCLTTLSQLDVQVLAQENEGFHTCTLMQYSHVLGVSDYIVRFEMLSIHCTASCRELTTAHVNTNANTVQD